jgi:hypothetical protein
VERAVAAGSLCTRSFGRRFSQKILIDGRFIGPIGLIITKPALAPIQRSSGAHISRTFANPEAAHAFKRYAYRWSFEISTPTALSSVLVWRQCLCMVPNPSDPLSSKAKMAVDQTSRRPRLAQRLGDQTRHRRLAITSRATSQKHHVLHKLRKTSVLPSRSSAGQGDGPGQARCSKIPRRFRRITTPCSRPPMTALASGLQHIIGHPIDHDIDIGDGAALVFQHP